MSMKDGVTGETWMKWEVEAAVATYFHMLRMQELGQKPNKSEYNRQLQKIIPARSKGSIERKHGNISAVLNLLGAQTLSGYSPLPNFQRLLIDVVSQALQTDIELDNAAIRRVETPAEVPLIKDFKNFVIKTPKPKMVKVSDRNRDLIQQNPIKRDYLERESRNRSLGLAGEILVMEYEARRLHEAGAKKLAERIEHVSNSRGDGAGFDVHSFDADGRDRFIEVKTTAYIAETPFYMTQNEVSFSNSHPDEYQIYRLFSFRENPKMFALPGDVSANCLLDPISYRASLLGT